MRAGEKGRAAALDGCKGPGREECAILRRRRAAPSPTELTMSDLIFYALAAVGMWGSYRMLKWNNRQKAARRAPERRAEAAQRGWIYEQEQSSIFEIERWRGSTDGIDWVGEAARTGTRRTLDGAARKGSATLITRWHTKQADAGVRPGAASAPRERRRTARTKSARPWSEITSPLAPQGNRQGARHRPLGQVRRGLSARASGHALKPGTLPATGYDGYSLMAADLSEARRCSSNASEAGAARGARRGRPGVALGPDHPRGTRHQRAPVDLRGRRARADRECRAGADHGNALSARQPR